MKSKTRGISKRSLLKANLISQFILIITFSPLYLKYVHSLFCSEYTELALNYLLVNDVNN